MKRRKFHVDWMAYHHDDANEDGGFWIVKVMGLYRNDEIRRCYGFERYCAYCQQPILTERGAVGVGHLDGCPAAPRSAQVRWLLSGDALEPCDWQSIAGV